MQELHVGVDIEYIGGFLDIWLNFFFYLELYKNPHVHVQELPFLEWDGVKPVGDARGTFTGQELD